MALLEIRTYPDPVLRKVAKPIDDINDDIIKLAEDMIETMRLFRGAGLAANQVGVPIRMIVLEPESDKKDRGNKKSDALILINPVIVKSEEEEIAKSKKTFFESYDIPEEEKESLNVILDSKRK